LSAAWHLAVFRRHKLQVQAASDLMRTLLSRRVAAKRTGGWTPDSPRFGRTLPRKNANEQRMLPETGASHVPRRNHVPLPDSVDFRHLPGTSSLQFVDSFDASQFERRGIDSARLDFSNET